MDFDKMKNEWQQQNIISNNEIIRQVIQRDKKLKKQNLAITILFSTTIFCLGNFVIPLITDNEAAMFPVAGLMFLLGFQAMIFWARNLTHNSLLNKTSKEQLKSTRNKLRYNLLVTNFFMPLYFILLSTLLYFYINNLNALPDDWKLWIMIPTGNFMLTMFIYGWFKQRKKDKEEIIPLLKSIKNELLEI